VLSNTVIFLNGTSSAGKTSLVEHLQEQLNEPFLHIGIDHFLFMLPARYRMDGKESHLGYCFKREDDDPQKISVTKGLYANKINTVMRATMKNLLTQNFNLIIDEVLFADDDYHAYLDLLQNYKVYFIAVKPPLEVAVQREKNRGGRMIGLARGLYDQVYRNKSYDLEIDTSTMTPFDAASAIVRFIQR
jgi:chloramphenicol 3-O phosphotransferase